MIFELTALVVDTVVLKEELKFETGVIVETETLDELLLGPIVDVNDVAF